MSMSYWICEGVGIRANQLRPFLNPQKCIQLLKEQLPSEEISEDGFDIDEEVIKAMRAYAKTIAREAFQNEVEECVADTAKVWARRLYESRYTEPMTDKLVKAEVQSYIKEQMSHKEMLDLIQGTVQAAVAECKDKTKQFAQTEVEKYLKGAVVMNAIHEEIKRVVPQAVLDALRGV